MINHCISEEEKSLLKSLIGSKLLCFKSQEKDSWNRIFGNISLVTENKEVEIRNELTETEYFGDTEDVSRFKVKAITSVYSFPLMIVDSVFETKVDEKITDILIANDEIVVKDSKNELLCEIITTEAIVIRTEASAFVISREWHLEEGMVFVKTADYERDVYPVDKVIEEWGDDGGVEA